MRGQTESGTPFEPVYGPDALDDFDPATALGPPGEFPYTRGVYPSMYTTRPWTMRQYAGFGTAAESNARYLELITHGTTGLSVAFDLPTQMGMDSDAPLAAGEVGKVGVAIDSIEDMRTLFSGIPLGEVSTSMTINAPAAVLLLLYTLVAEEQGVELTTLTGTIQNDILKEYIARGTYIYPPAAVVAPGQRHLRLVPGAPARAGTRSPSPATTWPRPGRRRRRRSRSPSPTGSPTFEAAAGGGAPSRRGRARGSAFFFNVYCTTTSSRRWPSSAPPGGCGPGSPRNRLGARDPKKPPAALPHPDRRGDAAGPAARWSTCPG